MSCCCIWLKHWSSAAAPDHMYNIKRLPESQASDPAAFLCPFVTFYYIEDLLADIKANERFRIEIEYGGQRPKQFILIGSVSDRYEIAVRSFNFGKQLFSAHRWKP